MRVARDDTREWTIGNLAKATGLTVRTLRYYDLVGLLSPSTRTEAGHRRYGAAEIQRLYRILALRSLGFRLSAIAELFAANNSETLLELARRQLDHTSRQIAIYNDLRQRLNEILLALQQVKAPSVDQLFQVMEVTRMTVRLSRIYTRSGDSGETHLGDRTRVRKTDPRVEAMGDVDELSSQIGLATATSGFSDRDASWLTRIQNDLYDVGADLAVPANDAKGKSRLRIGPEYVSWLEGACDEANSSLAPLKSFVLPGGTKAAAQLHVCRTVCRRAERHALRVEDVNPEVIRYLNRLSDLLFILGRAINGERYLLWDPGQHAAVGA
jgi:cob(I)alamin adenosyltransferase